MGEHALLAASGSEKWLNCTPSARLEETLPESTSGYAEEGRLAHEIAELKLRKTFVEPMGARTFNSRLKKLQEKTLYQAEMMGHTDAYLDYISNIAHGYALKPYVAIEKKLDYSSYAPEGFGTGDCIIISGNTLHVIDFKYGKGVPVSAINNSQMKLYALGAHSAYSILYGIEIIKIAIVQPRLDSISEFDLTVDELLTWGESIKPIAQMAFSGQGEFNPGDHCRFCRAKSLCRARADFYMEVKDKYLGMVPPLISNEEVAQILMSAADMKAWITHIEEYALAECLQGREIPGWKAVEGRSNRQFSNTDAVFTVIKGAGYDEALLYERKPITLTKVEELLGKPKFSELLTPYINRPPGKPTLAVDSDKREAIKRSSAQDDFGNEENGGNNNG
jgi:hypothetical protein